MTSKIQMTNDKSQNGTRSVTVKLNYAKISAQKVNLPSKLLRGKPLFFAERLTSFSKTKAASILSKLVKSAKAAAQLKGLTPSKLVVTKLLVNQGPSLKRGQPVARGTYHPIRKKTSHIVLTLSEADYGTKS